MTERRKIGGPFLPGNTLRGDPTGWHSHQERTPEAKATASRLRRFHAIKKQLLADRGGDPTAAQSAIAHNAAALTVWLEDQVGLMTDGEKFDISPVTTAMNTLQRMLSTLGINRVPRNITPSLAEYIERHPVTIDGTKTAQ